MRDRDRDRDRVGVRMWVRAELRLRVRLTCVGEARRCALQLLLQRVLGHLVN